MTAVRAVGYTSSEREYNNYYKVNVPDKALK